MYVAEHITYPLYISSYILYKNTSFSERKWNTLVKLDSLTSPVTNSMNGDKLFKLLAPKFLYMLSEDNSNYHEPCFIFLIFLN